MSVPKVDGQHVLSMYFVFYIFDGWSIVKLTGTFFAIWGGLGALLGRSWALFGPLGALLRPLGEVLGALLGALWASWGAPEASWEPKRVPKGSQNRPKIDQKIDPKIDPKSSRIRDGQNRSGATPADVSEGSEG